jgi:hypothetical protein
MPVKLRVFADYRSDSGQRDFFDSRTSASQDAERKFFTAGQGIREISALVLNNFLSFLVQLLLPAGSFAG